MYFRGRIVKFKFSTIIIILLALTILHRCTSRSATVVTLIINPQKNTIIDVMPFSAAKKRLEAKGPRWRGMFTDLVDIENGLYTPFEKNDLEIIRKSLIKSLRHSKSFKLINDVKTYNEAQNGIRLYLCFDKSGTKQTSRESFCFINACAWTEIANDSVVSKIEIKTVGKSNWSLNNAKDEATEKFLLEIAKLFSD